MPGLELIFVESGGDNLAAAFSPELVDAFIYVIDVAGGDKIPRKGGPGIRRSGLLVINKIDLAPYVGASLEVMDRDARRMRGDRPFVFTNLKTGEGLDSVVDWLEEQRAHGLTASGRPRIVPHSHSHDEDDTIIMARLSTKTYIPPVLSDLDFYARLPESNATFKLERGRATTPQKPNSFYWRGQVAPFGGPDFPYARKGITGSLHVEETAEHFVFLNGNTRRMSDRRLSPTHWIQRLTIETRGRSMCSR